MKQMYNYQSFISRLNDTITNDSSNYSHTLNGALAYRSTGSNLVNLNYSIPNMRTAHTDDIISLFIKAYNDDPEIALKYLFYLSDIRKGLGERRSFRTILHFLAYAHPEILKNFIQYIPYYNRYDSLLELYNTPLQQEMFHFILLSLQQDLKNFYAKKPISLLAKWLPRTDSSNKHRAKIAKKLALYISKETYFVNENYLTSSIPNSRFYNYYNRLLASLRAYLDLTEIKTSSNQWQSINYSQVPSKANLKYAKSFMRHDPIRRQQFLDSVRRNKTKINASTIYPHEIVQKYCTDSTASSFVYSCNSEPSLSDFNEDLELLWKNLPSVLPLTSSTQSILVVADGSASMWWLDPHSHFTPVHVANALAIYCAEHLQGEFHNTCLTFSAHPQIVHLNGSTLYDKIATMLAHNECANTNIYATFKLILDTAKQHFLPQSSLPNTLLIISDMQFDEGADFSKPLFKQIKQEYAQAGYSLPNVVFWNVASYNTSAPITANEYGFNLVSGFSVNILKSILTDTTNAYESLFKILQSDRYSPIHL